jgi:hypothetical protein
LVQSVGWKLLECRAPFLNPRNLWRFFVCAFWQAYLMGKTQKRHGFHRFHGFLRVTTVFASSLFSLRLRNPGLDLVFWLPRSHILPCRVNAIQIILWHACNPFILASPWRSRALNACKTASRTRNQLHRDPRLQQNRLKSLTERRLTLHGDKPTGCSWPWHRLRFFAPLFRKLQRHLIRRLPMRNR